jgi:hypothetical protein
LNNATIARHNNNPAPPDTAPAKAQLPDVKGCLGVSEASDTIPEIAVCEHSPSFIDGTASPAGLSTVGV